MTLEEFVGRITFNRTLRKQFLFENVKNGEINRDEFERIIDWLELSDHFGDKLANEYMEIS